MPSKAGWLGHQQTGTTLHFWDEARTIERYDLNTRTWLAPVALDAVPNAVHAVDAGYYVATGQRIDWIDASGVVHPVWSSPALVFGLAATADFLLLIREWSPGEPDNFATPVVALRRSDYSVADQVAPRFLGRNGHAFSSVNERFFTWTSANISAVGLRSISVNAAGRIQIEECNQDGLFDWKPQRVWIDPQGSFVVDEFGGVRDAESLLFQGGLGFDLDGLAFTGDGGLVAYGGGRLLSVNPALHPVGEAPLGFAPASMIFDEGDLLVFEAGTSGNWQVHVIDPAAFSALPLRPVLDPALSSLDVDESFVCRLGYFYFLSREHGRVFSWDPFLRKWRGSLSAPGSITGVAYDEATHAVFTVSSGPSQIHRFDLRVNVPVAVAVTGLVRGTGPIVVAGDRLIVSADRNLYVFEKDTGELLWQGFFYSDPPISLTWRAETSRLYFASGRGNPNRFHIFGFQGDELRDGAPRSVAVPLMRSALRFSPDGRHLALTSGTLLETGTFEEVSRLPDAFLDAAWSPDSQHLYTILLQDIGWRHTGPEQTRLQSWDISSGTLRREVELPWRPLRLFLSLGRPILVVRVDGLLRFVEFSPDLHFQSMSALGESAANPVSWGEGADGSPALHWLSGAVDPEDTVLIERADHATGDWILVDAVPATDGHWKAADLSGPADFRLRTGERRVPDPSYGRTVEQTSYLRVEWPRNEPHLYEVRYQIDEGPWETIVAHYGEDFVRGPLSPSTNVNIEVFRDVVTAVPLDASAVSLDLDLEIQWYDYGYPQGYQTVLQMNGGEAEWIDLRVYDRNTSRDRDPPVELKENPFGDFRLVARPPEGADSPIYFEIPARGDLHWVYEGAGVDGFKVEMDYGPSGSVIRYQIAPENDWTLINLYDLRSVQGITVWALKDRRFEPYSDGLEISVQSRIKWAACGPISNPELAIMASTEGDGGWAWLDTKVCSNGRFHNIYTTEGSWVPTFAVAFLPTLPSRTIGFAPLPASPERWNTATGREDASVLLGRTVHLSHGWAFSEFFGFVYLDAPVPYVFLPERGWAVVMAPVKDRRFLFLFEEERWISVSGRTQ